MSDPINLNKARKARAKAARATEAAENRVLFGRPKVEKQVVRLETDRDRRALDGKKRED